MALFGQAKDEDVTALIAKKQYAKAIDVIKAQLKAGRPDPRMRLQLADVLVLAGREREAVMILTPLADEFAREGFAAKAISVLKKIQKIDPGRRDVGAKLAGLIQEKQRAATASLPQPSRGLEIGIEQIGFEAPAGRPISVPARPEPSRPAAPEIGIEADGPEISFAPSPARQEPAPTPPPSGPPPRATPAARVNPAPVVDRDLFTEEEGEAEPFTLELEPPAGGPAPVAARPQEIALESEPLAFETEASDLAELEVEPEPEVEPEITLEPEPEVEVSAESEPPHPMSEAAFADELLALVDQAFVANAEAPEPAAAEEASAGGASQIVVSPLFKDFSVDEMVAVIHGLKLLTFEPGDIIITEGEPGESLYMLTSGTAKVLKKDASGRQVRLGQLKEGAFFGEISILTGRPRTATIVAVTRCELLELDRPTLDSIAQTHPHVMHVLKEFCEQRRKKG